MEDNIFSDVSSQVLEVSISRHFKERYVERILKISGVPAINHYINNNIEGLTTDILSLFEKAKLFYVGQVKNHPIRAYYRYNNLVLVLSENKDTLLTIFEISFSYTAEANNIITDAITAEIETLTGQLLEADKELSKYLEDKDNKLAVLKLEKENLEMALATNKAKTDEVVMAGQAFQFKKSTIANNLEKDFVMLIGKNFGSEI